MFSLLCSGVRLDVFYLLYFGKDRADVGVFRQDDMVCQLMPVHIWVRQGRINEQMWTAEEEACAGLCSSKGCM